MNYIDIVILIPLLWAGYRGFTKGVIIEVASIVAFVLGVWGGIHFSDLIGDFVKENISDQYEPVISFTIIFIAIVVGVFVIGKTLEKVVNLAQLKIANKVAGAIFGVGKIVLIWSFLIIIINQYDSKFHFIPDETKDSSLLYKPLIDLSKAIVPAVEDSDTFKENAGGFNLFGKN